MKMLYEDRIIIL